ncbi:hypothetical protein GCM10009069_30070 [Algimonas arctica]|uniref:Beta-lactamase n=1 Tax=Algimonas arctica TaxID=1479486 RepID=A0A8J3CUH9_9PROT|nr:SEL1-like repeat protein [Algimonas arctica]GHB05635.1 hypothetical protein GCM10009069_30070 [Algimonas arctica]
MNRSWSVLTFSFLLFLCCGGLASAQSLDTNKAKAYYFQAEKALGQSNYETALTAITQTELLLEGENPKTAAMKVKIYFGQGDYIKAKAALDNFYTYDSGDALTREMSDYLIKIDDKVNEQIRAKLKADKDAREAKERAEQAAVKAEQDKQVKILADDRANHNDLERKCLSGSGPSCLQLAVRYDFGKYPTTSVDSQKAASFYVKSCYPSQSGKPGYYSGCGFLASLYDSKKIAPNLRFVAPIYENDLKDIKSPDGKHEALILYKMGCGSPSLSDHRWACHKLADYHRNGLHYEANIILAPSHKLARAAYKKSCAAGYERACEASGNLPLDQGEQLVLREAECSKGDFEKCQLVGYSYLSSGILVHSVSDDGLAASISGGGTGEKISVDTEKAEKYLSKACEGNQFKSCFALGNLLSKKDESIATVISAYDAHKKACIGSKNFNVCDAQEALQSKVDAHFSGYQAQCQADDAQSCEKLGDAYDIGVGVDIDHTRAAGYFLKGCNLGRARSCNIYGVLLRTGQGLPKDHKEAVTYYMRACKSGYPRACSNVGEMYAAKDSEAGVDLETSIEYYQRGCVIYHKRSCLGLYEYINTSVALDQYKKHLTSLRVLKFACDWVDSKICPLWNDSVNPKVKKRVLKKELPVFN